MTTNNTIDLDEIRGCVHESQLLIEFFFRRISHMKNAPDVQWNDLPDLEKKLMQSYKRSVLLLEGLPVMESQK
tara:strand:+ start:236 stop:454 length:219 start_codon:yes stop_codon:yes gene_type:complete